MCVCLLLSSGRYLVLNRPILVNVLLVTALVTTGSSYDSDGSYVAADTLVNFYFYVAWLYCPE